MPTTCAISLDIWGTLLRSDPAFKPARNEMLRAALAPSVSPERFNEVMRSSDREADEITMARGTDVGFAERTTLALTALDVPAQLDASTVERLMAQQAELARAHHPIALDPRLPDLVADFARRMPVVLTSNTGMLPGVLMRDLLVSAGFHGDLGMVFSNEVEWAKPDRRIFEISLTFVQGTAAEPIASSCVVHIGDNPVADVEGARAAGLSAVLVEPDGESTVAALEALR